VTKPASRQALEPTGAPSLRVDGPRHEADHPPQCSTEVKNEWSYTYAPPYVSMMRYLVKQRDNFTFTLSYKTSHKQNSSKG